MREPNSKAPKHFVLVGNAPYTNRGCEAIVRGTMAILRREFGDDIRVTQVTFGSPEIIREQAKNEIDTAIANVPLHAARWSKEWFSRHLARVTRLPLLEQTGLKRPLKSADVALQVGGDNYTFDYGVPRQHMNADAAIQASGVPLVLWGASVGPFESEPQFTQTMFDHLNKMDGIFIREPDSFEYMKSRMPEDRVWRIVDPAFVMEPVQPLGIEVPQNAIALNFSPLLAKYITGGDLDELVTRCAEIVVEVSNSTRKTILLLPHVTSQHISEDDADLLRRIAEKAAPNAQAHIECLPSNLNAAELKWIISKCDLVAAARTHATIAGFSTSTPTVSFSYSRKARGLNKEIYGSLDYCIEPGDMTPARVSSVIQNALESASDIRACLRSKHDALISDAFLAGPILRGILERTAR